MLLLACEREKREFRTSPPGMSSTTPARQSALQPGPARITSTVAGPYDENAYAISQGQRLFSWFNCVGCHANGGGGMGPPLMDEEWIYGSAPENVYASIVEGRPNGMPSWGGRIPNNQVWQLVAYVRSLGGLTPRTAVSSRADAIMMFPESQILQEKQQPRGDDRPRTPAGRQP